MPVDFRYHITSLIAVFFALLVGLLIGIALMGDETLGQQVEFAKEAIDRQKDEIKQLEGERDTYKTFAKDAAPVLTANLLTGKRVAIIYAYPAERDPFHEGLPGILKQAGATVTSATTLLEGFRRLQRADAVKIFEEFDWPVPIDGEVRGVLAAKLGVHIAEGRLALPARLKEPPFRLIAVKGDYTLPADCVVMVAGLLKESDEPSVAEVDVPMIRGLQDAGRRVVACESGSVPVSTIALYQQARLIPTVEAADTPYGRVSLVLTIDRADGNFGPNGSALWPTLSDYIPADLRPAAAASP